VDEFVVRLIVAAAIAGVAAAAAVVSRRGRAWRRRPFESAGLEPGVHLFSSESCGSCLRARLMIERAGLSYSEHTYESEAPLFEQHGIDRVPTLVSVPAGGRPGWVAEGTPSERALLRWVGP
jgi:hypothetical protein